MSAPSLKLAPLPLLIWAMWPQLAQSSEAREVLMPAEISPRLSVEPRNAQILLSAGLNPVKEIKPPTALEVQFADSGIKPEANKPGKKDGSVEAELDFSPPPASASVVEAVTRMVHVTEPHTDRPDRPSRQPGKHGLLHQKPGKTALNERQAAQGHQDRSREDHLNSVRTWHYVSAVQQLPVPSEPSVPAYPDMPWMVPQLPYMARSNTNTTTPHHPHGKPLPAHPGITPHLIQGQKLFEHAAVVPANVAASSLDSHMPADKMPSAGLKTPNIGADDEAEAGAPSQPQEQGSFGETRPAKVMPHLNAVRETQQASINSPLPPPVSMAPLSSTWWVSRSPNQPPAPATPGTVITPVSTTGTQPQPPVMTTPVLPRMAEATGRPAQNDAERQMRAHGIWWLPPIRKAPEEPPVVVQQQAMPAPEVTRRANEATPATVSSLPQVKTIESIPIKPASTVSEMPRQPEKPMAAASVTEPTPASVTALPNVKPVESTSVKPAHVAPDKIEKTGKPAAAGGGAEPVTPPVRPAAKQEKGTSLQTTVATPVKVDATQGRVSSQKINEPIVSEPHATKTPDVKKEQTTGPVKSAPAGDETATAAAPSVQSLSGILSTKSARPILEPTPIPPVQIAPGVVLPKSNPVLQPRVVASIPATPRQLPLPFPSEERKTYPVMNKAKPVPFDEPKPVISEEMVDKTVKEPVRQEPLGTKAGSPNPETQEPESKGPDKPVPKQTSKVVDPCERGFRTVRSKVKRPRSLIMTSRKPAYDPCKGRYEPVNEVAARTNMPGVKRTVAKAANSADDAKVKRMCFEGGEIKPCK
ncbi:MAG: hypothetical protein HXY27_04300 [Hydrogenophilaceae bacterium]|nr:hypothetical protein [Hydrogenophilaceae bacterium]